MIIAVTIATMAALLILVGEGAVLLKRGSRPAPIRDESDENTWSPEELVALAAQSEALPETDARDGAETAAAYDEPLSESGGEAASADAYGDPRYEDAYELPILRLTREDVLYYAGKLLPSLPELRSGEDGDEGSGIEILRRAKSVLPDILMVDDRVFAIIFEKRRVLKLYLRAGTDRVKELSARYGRARSALSGGFYEWIVDTAIRSKETIYRELKDACVYALGLETSDARLIARLRALLEAAVETDSFRKDDRFKLAIKEKSAADAQYDAEHGNAEITRAALLRYIDKYADGDETRTEADPEKPGRAVTVSVGGKPYLRLYEHKGRVRVRANISYEYSTELLRLHPLVYKAGKSGTWYDVVIDDTFSDLLEVFAIAERAKAYVKEAAFMASL
ncbi:hypothetical protein FACS1894211_16510 [Clostridia bacterium]|nr:hypothetical protein FACS1894211_16510 [Clostridia bacterium]